MDVVNMEKTILEQYREQQKQKVNTFFKTNNPMLNFYNMVMSVFVKKSYVVHQNILNYKERRELRNL